MYKGRGMGIQCDDSKEVSQRTSSLDYPGEVAARLRRDAVQTRLKIDTSNAIIETVKEAERAAGETVEEDSDLEEEEQRTRFLQRVLLDYLAVNGGEDDPIFLQINIFLQNIRMKSNIRLFSHDCFGLFWPFSYLRYFGPILNHFGPIKTMFNHFWETMKIPIYSLSQILDE